MIYTKKHPYQLVAGDVIIAPGTNVQVTVAYVVGLGRIFYTVCVQETDQFPRGISVKARDSIKVVVKE